LDFTFEVVLPEISSEFFNETVGIAQNDKWFWVWHFLLQQVGFYFLSIVAIWSLSNDSFNIGKFIALNARLDVLKVDIVVLCVWKNRSKEEINSIESRDRLKKSDDWGNSQSLEIL
jgi:hypothetical protein